MTSVRGPRPFQSTQARASTSPSSAAPGKPGHGETQPVRAPPDPPPVFETGLE